MDRTQLSLRTIQRIENDETDPRGETLNRLATALNLPTHELFNWSEQEDSGYLAFFNLSALTFLFFPLSGIIVPLGRWALKKNKIKHMEVTGKRLINFQVTWSLLIVLIYLFVVGNFVYSFDVRIPYINIDRAIFVGYGLYAFNILLILVNAIRSLKSKKVVYIPAIPFLR